MDRGFNLVIFKVTDLPTGLFEISVILVHISCQYP